MTHLAWAGFCGQLGCHSCEGLYWALRAVWSEVSDVYALAASAAYRLTPVVFDLSADARVQVAVLCIGLGFATPRMT